MNRELDGFRGLMNGLAIAIPFDIVLVVIFIKVFMS